MNFPQPHPPSEAPSPPQPSPPSGGSRHARSAGWGIPSLVVAFAAPFSLVGTVPVSGLFTVAAYYLAAPMHVYRLTPLIVLSLPVLAILVSVALAIASLRGAPAGPKSRRAAIAALGVDGMVFTLGLVTIQGW